MRMMRTRSLKRVAYFVAAVFLSSSASSIAFDQSAFAHPRQQKSSIKSNNTAPELRRRFETAAAAYHSQQFADALRELQILLKVTPNSFDTNELTGLVYAAMGQEQKANIYLAKAVRLNPNVSAARTTLATNLVRLHRNNEAEAHFRKAAALEPRSYDANHNLGEFYIQSDQLDLAIPYLEHAQEINPRVYNNGYDLALSYLRTGNLDQARSRIEELIKLEDTAELHSLLGEVEEKAKHYLISAAQYQRAAQMDPSENNIFAWGGELLLHHTFEPAIEIFRAGIARYPDSSHLELGLGIALNGLGHFEKAAEAFFRASDINPFDPLPLIFLGKGYENLSAPTTDAVVSRLKRFLETDRHNASLRYYYAMGLWKLRQSQEAAQESAIQLPQIESLLKNAISLDPQYADAYLQLGILYMSQRQYSEAIAQYERALKINANTAAIHYRLGQAYSRTGATVRAKREFAEFERLHTQEIADTGKQNAEIQQFVYTIRNSSTTGKE